MYLTGFPESVILSALASVIPGILGLLVAYAIHTARRASLLRQVVITASGVFANFGGVPLAFLKFSRDDEKEADCLGLQYMYKAGYDPSSYMEIFSKVLQEERSSPGSVPKIFMDHPPTPDRIVALDKEMKTILPARPQSLVSTSEFNDVQARLKSIMTNRRRGRDQNAPTLQKRDESETAGTKTQKGSKGDQTDDKPPVLKRRD